MPRFILALAALALMGAPVLAAQEVAMTADEKVQTDWALARGQLIYRLDRAAWTASDAILDKFKGNKALSEVRGWIVEPASQGESVTFYGLSDATPFGLFVAETSAGTVSRVLEVAEPNRALTETQLRLIKAVDRARSTAAKDKLLLCAAKPFNTVAIPPATPGGAIDVYLLTPQTKAGILPFGGHHKVTVAADGSTSTRPFTNGCIDMGPLGASSVATISHVLDPTPTEVHVFTSLTGQTPVIVVIPANKSVWTIENARLAKVKLD